MYIIQELSGKNENIIDILSDSEHENDKNYKFDKLNFTNPNLAYDEIISINSKISDNSKCFSGRDNKNSFTDSMPFF